MNMKDATCHRYFILLNLRCKVSAKQNLSTFLTYSPLPHLPCTHTYISLSIAPVFRTQVFSGSGSNFFSLSRIQIGQKSESDLGKLYPDPC